MCVGQGIWLYIGLSARIGAAGASCAAGASVSVHTAEAAAVGTGGICAAAMQGVTRYGLRLLSALLREGKPFGGNKT